jgi:hypothetical protein
MYELTSNELKKPKNGIRRLISLGYDESSVAIEVFYFKTLYNGGIDFYVLTEQIPPALCFKFRESYIYPGLTFFHDYEVDLIPPLYNNQDY